MLFKHVYFVTSIEQYSIFLQIIQLLFVQLIKLLERRRVFHGHEKFVSLK